RAGAAEKTGGTTGRTAMLRAAVLAFVLGSAASGTPATPGPGWEQVSAADGIVVYQKHQAGLDIISLRGEATIDASTTAILDVMKDNARATEWMPLVAGKHDLKAVGPTERIESTHIGMPWPLTDRY